MEIIQAVILGIVQSLTEFLPVSSSGHLIVIPVILGWEEFTNNLTFDVSLHVGTAFAVLVYFWRDWVRVVTSFLRNLTDPKNILVDFDSKFLVMIMVGTIPAAVVGLAFQDLIIDKFRQPLVVLVALVVFALLLFAAEKLGGKRRTFETLGFSDAIIIGLAQAIALVPGVSRSGITITAGLFRGLNREVAARFSFMLATPVVFGAGVLRVKDAFEVGFSDLGLEVFVVGTLVSGVVGWYAIKFLLKYVLTHNYYIFVWYRIILGIILFILYFT